MGRQIPRTTQENMQYGSDWYINLVWLKTDKKKVVLFLLEKNMHLKVSLSERVLSQFSDSQLDFGFLSCHWINFFLKSK
jgi:hypothetical protein